MKKFIYSAVAVLVAFSACTKNETLSGSAESESPIIFEAPVVSLTSKGVDRRAALYTTTFPTSWAFKVEGKWYAEETTYAGWSSDTKAYMPLSTVSYDASIESSTVNGAWHTTDATYYWPKTGKMAFQAYYCDENGTPTITNAGLTLTDYQAVTTSSQTDIMYATPIYDKKKADSGLAGNSGNTYDGVQIPFAHALSAIKFTATTDVDYSANVKFILHEITINGLGTKANFAQNAGFNSGYSNAPAWSTTSEVKEYTREINGSEGYELVYNDVAACEAWYESETDSNNMDLLVIPQLFTDNDAATITVKYALKTKNGAGWNDEVPQTYTVKLNTLNFSDNNGTEFKPGHIYTFNIKFGLDEIFFSPEVEDWTPITAEVEDGTHAIN